MGCSSSAWVKTVHAPGFDTAENFKFTYDQYTGLVVDCLPEGLAAQNNLTNYKVLSFKLPRDVNEIKTESGPLMEDHALSAFARANLGKQVRFDLSKVEHSRCLRELRPLTVNFEPGPTVTRRLEPPRPPRPSASEDPQMQAALVASREEAELQRAIEASRAEQ